MKEYTLQDCMGRGPCAVIAISETTGLSMEEVWEVAKKYYSGKGFTVSAQKTILKLLGWEAHDFKEIMTSFAVTKDNWIKPKHFTVNSAEKFLQKNFPDKKIIASVVFKGSGHAIYFKNGKFQNTLGLKNARILSAREIVSSK